MSNLKILTIALPPSPEKTMDIAFEKQMYDGVSYIDTLSITYSRDAHFFPESYPNTNEDQINYNTFLSMLKTLTELTPFVRTLYLYGDSLPAAVLSYAASLRQLVHLFLGKIGGTTFPPVTLENVEEIQVSSTAIISSIRCPASIRLRVTNIYSSEVAPNLSLDIKTWSNLRTLVVDVPPSSWKGISLPQVEEISVDSAYGSRLGEEGSSLLEELALHTDSFPCLSRLRLRRFPEWDILFLMLERRNLPRDNLVKPPCKLIDSITLPFRPASWIVKSLIDRLNGKLSVRPTNYELSYHSIALIYFDRDIEGCDPCHRAFRNCTAPISYFSFVDEGNQADQELWVCTKPPIYPETSEAILLSRAERAEIWRSGVRSMRPGRQRWCPLNPISQEFTRHTALEDVL